MMSDAHAPHTHNIPESAALETWDRIRSWPAVRP